MVHFVEHGDARPQHGTVLLMHGFSCDHRLMTGGFEPVFTARDGWRRVYLDLPGHGRSIAGPDIDSTDAVLRAVTIAASRLIPDGPLLLAGQSYGGYLIQGMIRTDPGRYAGACMVAPPTIAQHDRRILPEHQVLARDDAALADVTLAPDSAFEEVSVVKDARTLERTQQEVQPGIDLSDTATLERIEKRYTGSFEDAPVQVFDRPSLLVTGRQDAIVGYVDQWSLTEQFSRLTSAVLDRGGHNVHIEQEVLFSALVHEWLDRVEESLS
ncbi:hypothetical protein VV02_08030 [Luteipulveratus mongoliensis]|uniref:AB hydrolase-1 domain-containing protein n=1 Tax=Luteipulveratus mongoliensis TaxID=571913 RepID=A0A0K1JPV8_9MICO|nr:hypothetical protein VV02_08030 [Luteipulveratus mongoliensis]